MQVFIKIHPDDKVAVALEPLIAHRVLIVEIGRASCRERV